MATNLNVNRAGNVNTGSPAQPRSNLDRLVARLLMVNPAASIADRAQATAQAERRLGWSLAFSGVRCILQYAILPFVLPFIGVASEATIPLMLILSGIAVISIVSSLRRFWQIDYKHKWMYLGVAVTALILLAAFISYDVHTLLTTTGGVG